MRTLWEPCNEIVSIESRGPVRCWRAPLYVDTAGRRLCEQHAADLVRQHGQTVLHAESRERWLARSHGTGPGAARPRRALVIEGDPDVRDSACESLKLLGLEADAAGSGPEGLALFEHAGYDLVMADLMMPGMTGWEVADAVRKRDPKLGLIMVTRAPGEIDPGRARASRLAILSKPFRLEDLKAAIAQAIGSGPSPRSRAVGPSSPGNRRALAKFPSDLRASLGAIRKVAGELDLVLRAAETIVHDYEALRSQTATLEREHEALREAHDAAVGRHESATAALDTLRAEHQEIVRALEEARGRSQALVKERQSMLDTLRAVTHRLRG